jgi:CheY-like chemotaxis protein
VLTADDQPEILRALSFICSAEGYETVTVNSPAGDRYTAEGGL